MSQKEKDKIKEYQNKKYQELVQYKKKQIILTNINNEWKNIKI